MASQLQKITIYSYDKFVSEMHIVIMMAHDKGK